MPEHPGVELSLLETTVATQRALLRARRPDDVVAALERTVHALGGSVVPGHVGGDEVLHLDLSLGVRDTVLPWAPPGDPSRDRILRILPALLEDARRLVHLLWAREDLDDPALRDELTGALHVEATTRLVARAASEDVLLGFGVEGTGAVEQVHGRARIEVLLRQLARFVRSEMDVEERLGRLPGPALAVLLPHPSPHRASELADRVTIRWQRQRALAVPLRTAAVPLGADPAAARDALLDELRTDDEVGSTWIHATHDPS